MLVIFSFVFVLQDLPQLTGDPINRNQLYIQFRNYSQRPRISQVIPVFPDFVHCEKFMEGREIMFPWGVGQLCAETNLLHCSEHIETLYGEKRHLHGGISDYFEISCGE
jgi:hypothetical protein